MKYLSTRNNIRTVAARWEETYRHWLNDSTKGKILDQLKALNTETATAKDIFDIIGNWSWTSISCDECGDDKDAVIELGQEPDYESATAHVCIDCLQKAMELAKESA
jgi:hypothetical protein